MTFVEYQRSSRRVTIMKEETREITHFPSTCSCARFLGVGVTSVIWQLRRRKKISYRGYFIKDVSDTKPWPKSRNPNEIPQHDETIKVKNGVNIILKNALTETVEHHRSMASAARKIGVHRSTVIRHLRQNGITECRGYYIQHA